MTELARLGLYVDSSGVVRATRELKKLEREGKGAERQSDKLKRSFGGLKTAALAVSGAIAAIGVTRLVGSVADAGLALDAMNSSLRVATGGAEQAAAEMEFLRQTSEQLGLDIRTSGDAFASLAAAAKGTALEGQGARDIFVAVSEAMTALGRDSQATEGALRAIEQMISKGNVSAEELRGQLGERLPGAFQIAARSIGVTTQELDKMLRDGEVLAADLLPKLAGELRNTFSAEAERRANGLQAEINRFKNAVFDLQTSGNMDAMAEAIRDVTTLIANPQFQTGFAAFVSGVIQLGGATANAAAAIGNLFPDTQDKMQSALEQEKKLLEQLKDEYNTPRILRINPFISTDELGRQYDAQREKVRKMSEELQRFIWMDGAQTPSSSPVADTPLSGSVTTTNTSSSTDRAREEAEKLAESYNRITMSLQQERSALQMTERELAIFEASSRLSANATDEMRQEVERLAGKLYDEQKAAEKAAEAEAIRNQLFSETRTALEAYNIEQARLNQLLKDGVIDQDTFNRKIAQMKEQLKQSYGVVSITTEDTADEMTKFMERAAENMQDAMANGFFDIMQGNFDDLGDSFKATIDRMVADMLASQLLNFIMPGQFGGAGGWFGNGGMRTDSEAIMRDWGPSASGLMPGEWEGQFSNPLSGIGDFFGNLFSFDGGGYTGSGPRTGGLDGKGGMLAMVHPNETVVDHTKGQSSQSITISPTYHINSNNPQAVRQTIDQSHKQLAKQLQHAQRNM